MGADTATAQHLGELIPRHRRAKLGHAQSGRRALLRGPLARAPRPDEAIQFFREHGSGYWQRASPHARHALRNRYRRVEGAPLGRRTEQIISQTAGRYTVGLPLCRDDRYIASYVELTDDLLVAAGAVRALLHILRPVMGAVMGRLFKPKVNRTRYLFAQLHRSRLTTLDNPSATDANDFLQIMMRRYTAEHRPVKRLIITNFGTIHQPTLLAANELLNTNDSDAEFGTVAVLPRRTFQPLRHVPDRVTPDMADHSI